MSYSKPLPVDQNRNALQDYPPAFRSQARYGAENSSSSSVISLTDNTTSVEVSAVNGPAVLRWIPVTETAAVSPFGSVISAIGTANFDHVIPTGTTRKFVVPKEVAGTSSTVGVNIKEGLFRRVAIKSIGVASVLTSEF